MAAVSVKRSIVRSVSSCNKEETNEAKIKFQDHDLFTSYLPSIEKSVTYGLLPKRKGINLRVTFSLFSNSKHK